MSSGPAPPKEDQTDTFIYLRCLSIDWKNRQSFYLRRVGPETVKLIPASNRAIH